MFSVCNAFSLLEIVTYSSRMSGRVTRTVLMLWNLLFGNGTIYVVNIQGTAGRDQICWSLLKECVNGGRRANNSVIRLLTAQGEHYSKGVTEPADFTNQLSHSK